MTSRLAHFVEGARRQRHILLKLPDRLYLGLRDLLRPVPVLALRAIVAVRAVVPVGRPDLLHHVKVDAYLEEAQGGHDAARLRARAPGHILHRLLQVFVRGHCESEPEIELARAAVVVADSRMLVDGLRALAQGLRREAHGDQGGLVSQPPCVEDRAYLPDDVALLEIGRPVDGLLLGDSKLLAKAGKGLFSSGKSVWMMFSS